jgi:hypothetical protein
MQLVLDVSRLRGIAAMTVGFWWRWGGSMAAGALVATTLVAIAAATLPGGATNRGLAWVVAMMMASYYLVWMLSPLETVWLVTTTFDRLMAQVWPTLVLVAASGRGNVLMQARPRTS